MYLTTLHSDGSLLAQFGVDEYNHQCYDFALHMRDFQIVNMPKNRALFSIDHFVSDAPIILVDFETPRDEGGSELAPE